MRALAYQVAGRVSAAEFQDETADRGGFVYRTSRLGPEKPVRGSEFSILLGSPGHLSASAGTPPISSTLPWRTAAQKPPPSLIHFP